MPRNIAHADAYRGPRTDPRDGRLLRAIRYAFASGDELTTADLLRWCYPRVANELTTADLLRWCYPRVAKIKPWHREMVRRAARRVCVCLGRSEKGMGGPLLWRAHPKRMWLRSPSERRRRQIQRLSQRAPTEANTETFLASADG